MEFVSRSELFVKSKMCYPNSIPRNKLTLLRTAERLIRPVRPPAPKNHTQYIPETHVYSELVKAAINLILGTV